MARVLLTPLRSARDGLYCWLKVRLTLFHFFLGGGRRAAHAGDPRGEGSPAAAAPPGAALRAQQGGAHQAEGTGKGRVNKQKKEVRRAAPKSPKQVFHQWRVGSVPGGRRMLRGYRAAVEENAPLLSLLPISSHP
eukprot:TRINITY_DN1410_c1_g1_i18.p2 TRINITY_DN1410_c1_g1~~TRINITY_DN1410_c1_g1_i18.p2  ORF type:complete len:135 (-),score=15.36 TRINITY_DN1410_c1_g1_i18:599-1003(-)